ncbi:Abnormal spindle-like microcephaly-associated protein homolog [Durusdinium trenchii]|uniref:Abnormal spindle-like microcephaly-associated protein homolog n=1 Tax=Durusdinium trenchii TaxID=1381693 RepID=A0ABP0IHN5_9DINO
MRRQGPPRGRPTRHGRGGAGAKAAALRTTGVPGIVPGTLEISVHQLEFKGREVEAQRDRFVHVRAQVVPEAQVEAETAFPAVFSRLACVPGREGDARDLEEELGVVRVPFCVSETELYEDVNASNVLRMIALSFRERDLLSGQDTELGQATLTVDSLNKWEATVTLRNKRGRGALGSVTVTCRFSPTTSSVTGMWTRVLEERTPCTRLRLFLAEVRTNTKEPFKFRIAIGEVTATSGSIEPGASGRVRNECLELQLPTNIGSVEEATLCLASCTNDETVLASATVPMEALRTNGTSWLQVGDKSCIRLCAIPVQTSESPLMTRLSSANGNLQIRLHVESSPGDKTYVVAHLFPLLDGGNRGRAKLRDVVRTETHEDASGPWEETISLPWAKDLVSSAADLRPTASVHLSLWRESPAPGLGAQLVETGAIGVMDLIEQTEASFASETSSQLVGLRFSHQDPSDQQRQGRNEIRIGAKFIPEYYSLSRRSSSNNKQDRSNPSWTGQQQRRSSSPSGAKSIESACAVRVLRAQHGLVKAGKLQVVIVGYSGTNQELELETAHQPNSSGADVVWNQLLPFGKQMGITAEDFLEVRLRVTHTRDQSRPTTEETENIVARGRLPITSLEKQWVSLKPEGIAQGDPLVAAKPFKVLIQLVDHVKEENTQGGVAGVRSSVLNDTRVPVHKQTCPGELSLFIGELFGSSHDPQVSSCQAFWIKMALADQSWTGSTTQSNKPDWNGHQTKFPIHWSINELSSPVLCLTFKGQQANGQFVEREFEPLDLSSLLLNAGQTVDTLFSCVSPQDEAHVFDGVETKPETLQLKGLSESALQLRVGLRFDEKRAKRSLEMVKPRTSLMGKVHVHIKRMSKCAFKDRVLSVRLSLGGNGQSSVALQAMPTSSWETDGQDLRIWDEHFVLRLSSTSTHNPVVTAEVLAQEQDGGILVVGRSQIVLCDSLLLEGHVFEGDLPVRTADARVTTNTKRGQLRISCQVLLDNFAEVQQDTARLTTRTSSRPGFKLTLLRAEELDYGMHRRAGRVAPFVRVSFGKHCLSSFGICHEDRVNPMWNQSWVLDRAPKSSEVRVELRDENVLDKTDALIAAGLVQLDPLQSCQRIQVSLVDRREGAERGKIELLLDQTSEDEEQRTTRDTAAFGYIRVKLTRGRKLRNDFGRVHKALVRVFALEGGLEDIQVGETEVSNDGMRKSDRVDGDRCFDWNSSFHLERRPGQLIELRVFDASELGMSSFLGAFRIDPATCGVSEGAQWVDVGEGQQTAQGKGLGQLEVETTVIPVRSGKLRIRLKHLDDSIPSRRLAAFQDAPEFLKARVEPDGICVRTRPNALTDPLELAFSNQDLFRDKVSLSLVCDDPDLAENVTASMELDVLALLMRPDQVQTLDVAVCHANTGMPFNNAHAIVVACFEVGVEKPSASAEAAGVLEETDREAEALRCILIKRLKAVFYGLDKDRSGTVSLEEFELGLKQDQALVGILREHHAGKDIADPAELFKSLDTDKNGQLSWVEFQQLCLSRIQSVPAGADSDVGEELVDQEDPFATLAVGDETIGALVKSAQGLDVPKRKARPRRASSTSKKGNKKGRANGKASSGNSSKARDITTTAKYNEHEEALRRINDPMELKERIRDLERAKSALVEENKRLKGQVLRVEGQAQRKVSKIRRASLASQSGLCATLPTTETTCTQMSEADDVVRNDLEKRIMELEEENETLRSTAQDPFSLAASQGGDEAFSTLDQDDDSAALRIKLRQMQQELAIKDELHSSQVSALEEAKQEALATLQEQVERIDEIEALRLRRDAEVAAEKKRAQELQNNINDINAELVQYRKMGDEDNSEEQWRLLRMKALEAEQDRKLAQARTKEEQQGLAAAKLQAVARASRAKQAFGHLRGRREKAATKIQAMSRGKRAQEDYTASKVQAVKASSAIQAAYRGRKVRSEVQRESSAATRIQSQYRGAKDRELAHTLKTEHESATIIQAQIRRLKSLRNVDTLRTQTQMETDAAVRIQSRVRAAQARQSYELLRDEWELEQAEHRAATNIQKTARRKRAQKDLAKVQQERAQQQSAALRIQRNLRSRRPSHHVEVSDEVCADPGAAGAAFAAALAQKPDCFSDAESARAHLECFLQRNAESCPTSSARALSKLESFVASLGDGQAAGTSASTSTSLSGLELGCRLEQAFGAPLNSGASS